MSITTVAVVLLGVIAVIWIFDKLGRGGGGVLLLLALLLGGGWLFVHSFTAFTQSTLVATVQASPLQNVPGMMDADVTIYNPDGSVQSHNVYELGGQRWELDADVVAFPDWFRYIGISNGYSISRVASQFDDSNAHTVHPVDLGSGAPQFTIPILEKSHYRAGVLEPADGVKYAVYVTPSGSAYAQHV